MIKNMKNLPKSFDVVVIGAGPVGCVTALALGRNGARVLLLEANPDRPKRLAGEWLHPPGLQVLQRLGVGSISTLGSDYANGQGFVVFPDDGTEPIRLDYPENHVGISCEHNTLVSALQEAAASHPSVNFIPFAQVNHIEEEKLSFENGKHGETKTVFTKRIIGADGRSSMVRKVLGIHPECTLISYMAGILLENVALPFEGFGHVLLGGSGPALIYRIGSNQIRVCLDVPIEQFRNSQNKAAYLWDAYGSVLPEVLLPAFRQALENRPIAWCANQFSPRFHYGREGMTLVGDAAGHCHPITATGMTLGFQDAECLARSSNFREFQRLRLACTYVPELLACVLYQVFTRLDDSALAIRQSVYRMWRQYPDECRRTMRLLSGAETNFVHFSSSFLKGVRMAVLQMVKETAAEGRWRQIIPALACFGEWLELPMAIGLPRLGYSGFTILR
jgi:2-polyprenyl-6-methoxyphenol hydroxylase-like FAD-dependent oxidoreductase